jgi:hypothetical protein
MSILNESRLEHKPRQSIEREKLVCSPAPRIRPKQLEDKIFVSLPHSLLMNPPIRHLNTENTSYVTPFEFAVAAALMTAAGMVWFDNLHKQSLKRGKRRIAEQKGNETEFDEDWKNENERRAGPKFDGDGKIVKHTPALRHTYGRSGLPRFSDEFMTKLKHNYSPGLNLRSRFNQPRCFFTTGNER